MNNLAHKMTNQLELDMRAFTRDLYDRQVAFLYKIPEEMQSTPADFGGFTPSGRAVLIECKQVKRRRLPIGCSNGLAPHQWTALELAHNCGAVAILVWRNGEHTVALPFTAIKDHLAISGEKSVPWALDFQDWKAVVENALRSAWPAPTLSRRV